MSWRLKALRLNASNLAVVNPSYTGQMFLAVGNAKGIFAVGINLKRMDIDPIAFVIGQNKIAAPTTTTLHMLITAIFQELAQGLGPCSSLGDEPGAS